MNAMKRTGLSAMLLALTAAPAIAQIPGMPLFTNPRYATGLRLHADIGQPTSDGTSLGALSVVQGGLTFALGPIGIGANVGMKKNDLEKVSNNCSGCTASDAVTGSVLAQLRLAGAGRQALSLSVFGGASVDLKATEFTNTTPQQDTILMNLGLLGDGSKLLTIPVGVAVGFRIPLGVASLNLWGAPRMNISKYINCPATSTACDGSVSKFRWAVGADLPIFRILSVRASYDSGSEDMPAAAGGGTRTVAVWGIGASIGIGGMR